MVRILMYQNRIESFTNVVANPHKRGAGTKSYQSSVIF